MKGYVNIPNSLAVDERLSLYAVRLYLILVRRVGKKEYCWPTNVQLSNEMHCSQSSIKRAIKELKDTGYIFTHEENKNGKTTRRIFIERLVCTDPMGRVHSDPLNSKQLNRASVSEVALLSTSDEPQIRI